MRVVRMRSDRAGHLPKSLRDRPHLFELAHPCADSDDAADARRPGAVDDSVGFAGEIREIQVAVAVDQHKSEPESQLSERVEAAVQATKALYVRDMRLLGPGPPSRVR